VKISNFHVASWSKVYTSISKEVWEFEIYYCSTKFFWESVYSTILVLQACVWDCVCERVMGLVRGKAAGSVFLGLPMVKVLNGYGVSEVPLPPTTLEVICW